MHSKCSEFLSNPFTTSHLPIVDACSIELMKKEGAILIRAQLGRQKLKTIADILSDVLSVRKGHFVFPWRTKDKPIGFQYIFSIKEKPIFMQGQEYPIRIPLEKRYVEFSQLVEEDEALDLWRKKLLWNAIGKKSLGRGRSLTHQTPWETKELVELLRNKNNGECFLKETEKSNNNSGIPLSIHSQICINEGINDNEKIPENLSEVPINKIRWDKNGKFIVEKALEAWIMENIDTPKGNSFRQKVLELNDVNRIVSFHNYLPFGVQGANIDVVVFSEKENGTIVAHILELKKDKINYKDFRKYEEEEINKYAKFIEKFLEVYGENFIIKKGVLSYKPSIKEIKEYMKDYKGDTDWFYYEINCEIKEKIIFDNVKNLVQDE